MADQGGVNTVADRGGVTTVAEGQGTSVGPVSQRAGGSSARGRSSSRSPAKEYDVTGTFDSLAQHLHSFSPLKWRRRGHPIERSSWKAITDFAAQQGMASDCVPHQIMDLAAYRAAG